MTLRHPQLLIFNGETTDTLRAALDALDGIEPVDGEHAKKILAMRNELIQELDSLERPNLQMRFF